MDDIAIVTNQSQIYESVEYAAVVSKYRFSVKGAEVSNNRSNCIKIYYILYIYFYIRKACFLVI